MSQVKVKWYQTMYNAEIILCTFVHQYIRKMSLRLYFNENLYLSLHQLMQFFMFYIKKLTYVLYSYVRKLSQSKFSELYIYTRPIDIIDSNCDLFCFLLQVSKKKANNSWRTSSIMSIQPTRFEILSDRTCPERKKRNAILYVFTVNGDTHGKQIEICFSSPIYLSVAHSRNR